jgi:hypothetical protein
MQNGWFEQDRNPTWDDKPASRYHRAAEAVADFCDKTYDRSTRRFGERPKPQQPKQQYRDPKTGRFAKRPKNKQHNHPPKKRVA